MYRGHHTHTNIHLSLCFYSYSLQHTHTRTHDSPGCRFSKVEELFFYTTSVVHFLCKSMCKNSFRLYSRGEFNLSTISVFVFQWLRYLSAVTILNSTVLFVLRMNRVKCIRQVYKFLFFCEIGIQKTKLLFIKSRCLEKEEEHEEIVNNKNVW